MRMSIGTVVFVIVGLGAPTGAGLFRVWVNQDAVQAGYELSRETRRKRDLKSKLRQLEVEYTAERSPQRLLEISGKLGFAPPTARQVFASQVGGEP